ncbi:MAG: hypothetical protein JWO85_3664 [Candidatus Eremiobacteraeota bacterium]|nr:hypothetical protein [Candidatus Eremiobacteraeota bacterium]
MSSKIEWTDETWNPVTGCTKVSPGCDHCYAATWAARKMGQWADRDFGTVVCHEDRLLAPLSRRKPTRYFVNSMSDLFHKDVPDEFIRQVFITMGCTQRHTFQVLTKRPERMRRWVRDFYGPGGKNELRDPADPISNAWLGVSVESNDYAWRADMLRETPAAVRFLSIEPMLGPVDKVSFEGIDWVIVGGESGHGARPMHPAWVRDVQDRCAWDNIPFFFKQWGRWAPVGDDRDVREASKTLVIGDNPMMDQDDIVFGFSKASAGRMIDGRTWDEFPAVRA